MRAGRHRARQDHRRSRHRLRQDDRSQSRFDERPQPLPRPWSAAFGWCVAQTLHRHSERVDIACKRVAGSVGAALLRFPRAPRSSACTMLPRHVRRLPSGRLRPRASLGPLLVAGEGKWQHHRRAPRGRRTCLSSHQDIRPIRHLRPTSVVSVPVRFFRRAFGQQMAQAVEAVTSVIGRHAESRQVGFDGGKCSTSRVTS